MYRVYKNSRVWNEKSRKDCQGILFRFPSSTRKANIHCSGVKFHDRRLAPCLAKVRLSEGTCICPPLKSGISRFDGTRWKSFTARDGLIDNITSAIRAQPDGSVWIGTSKGVSHFDGANWVSYTTADGLLDTMCCKFRSLRTER